ncbi:hypothetical protein ABZ806_11530 [Spirillospora sp. NPDC047418]
MEVVAWASVWLAGWGANSAYALAGGYRFLVQGLAYELPQCSRSGCRSRSPSTWSRRSR